MSTAHTRVPLWLVALLCLMAFSFQGTRGLWEPDEGRYSSGGMQMEQSGDWLIPTVDGETPHLTKPPLTYWALAASFTLLGRNEWAARLPGALAYIGTGLLLFGLGFKRYLVDPMAKHGVLPLAIATMALSILMKEGAKDGYSAEAQQFPSLVQFIKRSNSY